MEANEKSRKRKTNKMKTNQKKALAAVALAVVGMSGLSGLNGASVSVTNTFAVNLTTPDWVTNFVVPQLLIDTNIGESLDQVVFQLVSKLQADVNLANLEPNASNRIGGVVKGEVGVTPPIANGPYTNALQIGQTNLLGPLESTNILGLMTSVTSSVSMTDLSPFLGTGGTTVNVTGKITMAFMAESLDGKQASGGSENLIAAMLNVIYTYTAVPEASTWGAMGVLGAAALWHHRRRAAKKK